MDHNQSSRPKGSQSNFQNRKSQKPKPTPPDQLIIDGTAESIRKQRIIDGKDYDSKTESVGNQQIPEQQNPFALTQQEYLAKYDLSDTEVYEAQFLKLRLVDDILTLQGIMMQLTDTNHPSDLWAKVGQCMEENKHFQHYLQHKTIQENMAKGVSDPSIIGEISAVTPDKASD